MAYLAIAPVWFVACRGVTEPGAVLPERAERFAAPAAYRNWWSVTQQCSGLTGDFDAVTFYRVPGSSAFVLPTGGQANGAWYSNGNIIVVAGDSAYSGEIVRHEMLHALIGAVSGHPVAYYGSKCGGVVACANSCASEVAASPPLIDSNSPLIDASGLQIEASVTPSDLVAGKSSGFMTLRMRITNPHAFSVRVRLAPSGSGSTYSVFGVNFNGSRRSDLQFGSVIELPANGSRSRAFDQVISLLNTSVRFRGAIAAESTAVFGSPP